MFFYPSASAASGGRPFSCVGFLVRVLLSCDIACFCARLEPARQRRGWFGCWSWPLGLAHAAVLIRSCKSAGAGAASRLDFFVVISCGAKSGLAAVADHFCPVRMRLLVTYSLLLLFVAAFLGPPYLFGPIHRWLSGPRKLSWSFDRRDSLRRG